MTQNKPAEQIINPNELLDIPEWVNEKYFAPILEKDVPNYKCITKFTSVAATQPGENYTSILVRVIIDVDLKDGNSQQMSYILKTILDASNQGATFVKLLNLFPKEKQMYANYIPKFEQLYKDCGVSVKLAPKCLHVEETTEGITFVMEDLKRKEYTNVNRLKGFDFDHMQVVLNNLAEFHAASAVYEEHEGPFESMFNASFFNESSRSTFEELYDHRVALFDKALLECGLEKAERYIEKTPTFNEYFDEHLLLNAIDPNEFNVLNHGDFWANNIMFTHDECGKVQESLFIDFQVCKWGSPAQDLWYLITTSVDLSIKVKEFDHFIQIYHRRLVECLTLLKYKKPIISLRELHIIMLKNGHWGTFAAKTICPIILLPSDKDANMDSCMKNDPESDAFHLKAYTNPIYVQFVKQFFPFLYNKGIFDVRRKTMAS